MKVDEIRNMTYEEKEQKILELKKKMFFLCLQRGVEKSGNSAKYKKIRRSVARIKTIIREDEKKQL